MQEGIIGGYTVRLHHPGENNRVQALISLLKDTSLAANITVTEMFMATQRIVARTYESLPLYLEVAFIYLMFSTILTQVQRWGEKKLNAKGFSQNS